MKSLSLRLRPDPEYRHPMHDAVCRSPGLDREYVVSGRSRDGVETLVTYVEGDRAPYERAVESFPGLIEYDVAPDGPDAFYAYVRAELREEDRQFGAAMDRETVVMVQPTVFEGDGTVELTLVGHPEELQAVADDLPDGMAVEGVRIGDHAAAAGGDLTDPQREALAVAWEMGYFEVPRETDVEAVADRLDRSPGSTSELLRRAQRELVGTAVGAGP